MEDDEGWRMTRRMEDVSEQSEQVKCGEKLVSTPSRTESTWNP